MVSKTRPRINRRVKRRSKSQKAENYRKYYEARKRATPAWADLDKIEAIYAECRARNKKAGRKKFAVDHIIPIRGKTVSGLHVHYNLQIITKIANRKKSNKFTALMIILTAQKLDQILPNVYGTATLEKYIAPLNKVIVEYQLDSKERVAAFIAQTGHESGEYQTVRENLNYSAQALRKTFPKYFKSVAEAQSYARQPAKIANRVYANRMGNGDEASGDGWRFRGRGLIQITGRNNYTALAKYLGRSIEDTISYLETTEGAVVSAAWFWKTNNLRDLEERNEFLTLTRKINGGTNGLDHRKLLYERALSIL